MTTQFWDAVLAAGQQWAAAPVSGQYSAPLVSARAPGAQGVALWMQNVLAGFGALAEQPMITGSLASAVAPRPGYGSALDSAEGHAWQDSAIRSTRAITLLAAAMRSQLPGMPALPTPYSAEGGPWTTRELTFRVPWPRQLRAGQDKTDSLLVSAARQLEAPVREMRLGVLPSPALAGLRDALTAEPLWATTNDQVEALLPEDRRELSDMSRELLLQLRPEAITSLAGDRMLERGLMREQLVKQALQDARFSSRLDGWQQLFALTENALYVVQQIVVFGGVMALEGEVHEVYTESNGPETSVRVVTETANPFGIRNGRVVLVNEEAVPDAIVLDSVKANVSQTDEPSRLVIEGTLLPDTGAVLRASAVPCG